jgi:acetate kinase
MKNLDLALNAGSSCVKASVLRNQDHLMHAIGERLGTEQSSIHLHFKDEDQIDTVEPNIGHERALEESIKAVKDRSMLEQVVAVGHCVVRGGTKYHDSTLIDSDTLEVLCKCAFALALPWGLRGRVAHTMSSVTAFPIW